MVCRLGDGLHVQGIGRVSRGMGLMYLGYVLRSRLLVGGYVCAMVIGAVLGSGKGGLVTCPEAGQFPLAWSVSFSLCVCRCACGKHYGGRVASPSCVLQSAVPLGCV